MEEEGNRWRKKGTRGGRSEQVDEEGNSWRKKGTGGGKREQLEDLRVKMALLYNGYCLL